MRRFARLVRSHKFATVFLVIQGLFVLWVLSAALSGTGASPAEVAQTCGNHGWYPLWKSYQDCAAHSGIVAAHDVGKGLALAFQVILWVIVDIILGITFLVVRLSRRPGKHAELIP